MYLIYGFCNDLCRRCNTKGQKTAYWIAEGEQHPALGFDCINSVIYHPLFKLQSSILPYGSVLTAGARHLSRAPKQLWPGHTEWSNLCLIKLLIKLSHAKTVTGVNQQCLCSIQSAFPECPCANETEGKCIEFGSSRLRNNY